MKKLKILERDGKAALKPFNFVAENVDALVMTDAGDGQIYCNLLWSPMKPKSTKT